MKTRQAVPSFPERPDDVTGSTRPALPGEVIARLACHPDCDAQSLPFLSAPAVASAMDWRS